MSKFATLYVRGCGIRGCGIMVYTHTRRQIFEVFQMCTVVVYSTPFNIARLLRNVSQLKISCRILETKKNKTKSLLYRGEELIG